ncbi:WD40-repeat-containing domain protein [Haematococcus lacustris]
MEPREDTPALNLSWVFGNSCPAVQGNVVNLSDGFTDRVCYASAHTGVIFDSRTRRQLFLQGHCNSISCIAALEDHSIIITADIGQQSLLVLWDSSTGNPVKSVAQPHANGIMAMDISPGGAWLATVSSPNPATGEQEVALWALPSLQSDAVPRPAVLSVVPAGDVQLSVRFNMNAHNELVTNGRRRVYFWTSAPPSSRFKYYSPPLRSKDFKQSVGDFVASVFVPGSVQAVTGTSDGDLVVWDEQGITAQMGTRATDRRAIKLMRIHQQPITFLSTVGDYIVSGAKDGYVRFYDPLLRLVAWFEDLEAGPINAVSFSNAAPSKAAQTELADTLNRFMVPDFVVGTQEGKLVAVASAAFEEFDARRRKGHLIVEPVITDVTCVACHPSQPELAILGRSGVLQRWDMVTHTCSASRTFPKAQGMQLAYARDASFLAVGLQGGFLYLVHPDDLADIHIARNTQAAVTRLATAVTGQLVALADDLHQVLLYAHLPYKQTMRWEFVGKARSHHGQVVGLVFGETPAGRTRLFSLGADRRIVEYDLPASSPSAGLRIKSHQDFPGPQVPTALSFAPPLQYYKHHSTQTLLLITDNCYKVKLYDPDHRACVSTFLGPTFGGPLSQLVMFLSTSSDSAFLAYSTAERVVGLVAWPLDGDPARSLGLIAHPGQVLDIAISYDGRKLLTTGADGILNMWDVATYRLESQAAASSSGPGHWERVLGSQSLLSDLQDYFSYAQIKAQGEEAMGERQITGLVPVSMVPDIMRAVGFFPSEAEVHNLMNHIAFIAQSRDLESLTHLDFTTLLSLYVNHRPLIDVAAEDLAAAFAALGAPAAHGRLQREVLLSQLQKSGEKMAPEELVAVLQALTGQDHVLDAIPAALDAATFSAEVLGFEETET